MHFQQENMEQDVFENEPETHLNELKQVLKPNGTNQDKEICTSIEQLLGYDTTNINRNNLRRVPSENLLD